MALSDIKHIVVVMLENRSFDNILGWLYEFENPVHFIPDDPRRRYEGLYDSELFLYKNPVVIKGQTQYIAPIKGASTHTDSKTGAIYWDSPMPRPGEEFADMTKQLYQDNDPRTSPPTMKGFAQNYADFESLSDVLQIQQVMETYTPKQLPILNRLAKNYAVSDFWFASVPTQTNPNRAFMACGTSLGQINNEGTFAYGNFDTVTIWNRLHDIGATWQVFWQETYFPVEDDDNKGWTQKAFPKVVPITALDSFAPMSEFHRLARMGRLPAFSFIEPSWTIQGKLFDRERGLQGDEMHPPGDVRPAEDLVGQIYTSLTARLSAWKNTLLVITFDEHGGLFDHWGPPSNAVPPDTNTKDFDFKRLGGRVPTIFASPWIEEKTVVRAENPPTATRWFDHTSIPATVLKWKGLQPAEFGLGDRTKGAPSFEAVLNRTTPRPRGDVILGPKRTRPRASYVWMYDEFCLKYVTEGKYENWYLGPAYQESGIYYPTLREEATQGVRLSFTLGDLGGRDPVRQPLVHGSFVYVRSMESQLPDQTWHLASLDKNYDSPTQPYCRYAKDGNRSYVYWTVKLADPATAVVGQNIHFGDEVFIENRYVPSFSYWLPGRLVPSDVGILYTYLSFSEDKDYDMPSRVGRWRIEFPPNSARAGKGR